MANGQSKERGILGWFSLLQLHVWVLSLDSRSASSFLGIISTIHHFSFLFRQTKFANWWDLTWQRLKSRFLYWLAVDQNTQGNISYRSSVKKKTTKNSARLTLCQARPSFCTKSAKRSAKSILKFQGIKQNSTVDRVCEHPFSFNPSYYNPILTQKWQIKDFHMILGDPFASVFGRRLDCANFQWSNSWKQRILTLNNKAWSYSLSSC